MNRIAQFILGIVLTVLMGILLVIPAFADASITSSEISCNHFNVSGSSNAPYVVLELSVDGFFTMTIIEPVSSGSYNISGNFGDQPVGTILEVNVWGSPTNDFSDYDGEAIGNIIVPCVEQPEPTVTPEGTTSFSGPGIPSGFVFVYISCTTAVYDMPAGQPVGAAAVTEGQTWFVNPIPVEGSDGQEWTEIFVSSSINPYIPTECVG